MTAAAVSVAACVAGMLAAPVVHGETPLVDVGFAKVDATPQHPVIMAGYGSRKTEYSGVDTKLWARAMAIGRENPCVVVVLDNCGVPGPLAEQVWKRLASHQLRREQLVVSATHTHNAPNLTGYAPILWAGRTSPRQRDHAKRYSEFAVKRMAEAVEAALKDRRPRHVAWGQGRVGFGGNRRVLNEGRWAGFGFQRDKPVDHSLPTLVARDADGTVVGVWANYACHCTTLGAMNRIHSDWAGAACDHLELLYPQATSLITIGCGADVGPQPSGTAAFAKQHGQSIAKEVARLISANQLKPILTAPRPKQVEVQLPLEPPAKRSAWEERAKQTGFDGELARSMIRELEANGRISDRVPYKITTWAYGDALLQVFLPGEVVVDYSVRLNRELDWKRLWISGWSNGMPGYIPSRRVLLEGGYEPDFSQIYYGLPGRYLPAVEQTVIDGVLRAAASGFQSRSDAAADAPFHRLPSGADDAMQRLETWAQAKDRTEQEVELLDWIRNHHDVVRPAVRTWEAEGERTNWNNYAGDVTARRFIRQQNGAVLKWRTPVVEAPEDKASATRHIVFGFTGGLGWKSQPQTKGFLLRVGRAAPVSFDLTAGVTRWTNSSGDVQLVYLPTWRSDEDTGGFFLIRVQRERWRQDADAGQLRMTVNSVGRGSQRWFSMDVEQDFKKRWTAMKQAITRNGK